VSSASLSIPAGEAPSPVASKRHTLILLLYLGVIAALGAFWQRGAATAAPATSGPPHVLPLYLSLAAGEWLMVWFVRRGTRPAGVSLRELVGRTAGGAAIVRDLVIAGVLWGSLHLLGPLLARLFAGDHAASVSAFLPRTVTEIGAWALLSVSAGFCEELVYRGYLQRQLAAWTGSAAIGVVLQAAIFGASHAYQGVSACLRITLFGLLFGSVALWRRSLRPGMIAHAATDLFAGLFRM